MASPQQASTTTPLILRKVLRLDSLEVDERALAAAAFWKSITDEDEPGSDEGLWL